MRCNGTKYNTHSFIPSARRLISLLCLRTEARFPMIMETTYLGSPKEGNECLDLGHVNRINLPPRARANNPINRSQRMKMHLASYPAKTTHTMSSLIYISMTIAE